MSGISVGQSHPRPCSGKKTLRRCGNKGEATNVILIDVDSEISDSVVIIDIPDYLPKRNKESHVLKKDRNWSFRNVINIDDDDETPESSCPFGANNGSFSASTPLNRESFHVAEGAGDSTDKDCQFVQESGTPVRLSKCKRTYSGKASTSNHYGLDTECDLSGNDYPDCELVEDFSGEVQELWEKAVSRRRKDIHNVPSGIRGHDSTSSSINKDHQNAELKNATGHHGETSFCHTTGKSNSGNGGSSPIMSEKEIIGFTHLSVDAINNQAGDKDNSEKDSLSPAGACITTERENLKETDEYRRAMEQEWACRQEAVRIQAEIAQNERRLLKRKNAESMRVLDMERRQKERLEEMRSIKKKDEENMNLKDKIRAEVRIQLKQLEDVCQNMGSLLHSLGITVGSWPNPSPQEVQTAYKRALLAFHPDRASRSNVRQLVEAEEKFKLINRMKEKFPALF